MVYVVIIKATQFTKTKNNAAFADIIPAGISRMAVRGFFASKCRSAQRLNAIAAGERVARGWPFTAMLTVIVCLGTFEPVSLSAIVIFVVRVPTLACVTLGVMVIVVLLAGARLPEEEETDANVAPF